jgi:hypothetical protein
MSTPCSEASRVFLFCYAVCFEEFVRPLCLQVSRADEEHSLLRGCRVFVFCYTVCFEEFVRPLCLLVV